MHTIPFIVEQRIYDVPYAVHHYEEVPVQQVHYDVPPQFEEKPKTDEWYETVSTDIPYEGPAIEVIPLWPHKELEESPYVAERKPRSDTKPEDYLLLKNDDLENIPYAHGRPHALSYTSIEEQRSIRSRASTVDTGTVNLLWRQQEFRASLYEADRKRPPLAEPTIRRETEPIIRRRSTIRGDYDPPGIGNSLSIETLLIPGHITHHFHYAEVHELKRSHSELGKSTSSLASDAPSSVYDQHLHRQADLPFSPRTIETVDYEVREYGVPPHRPLESIPSLPIPLSPLLEKLAEG
jgi:hypothetical protein